MVAEIVVEHPHVRSDAGVKGINNFQKPIQNRLVKRGYMLMMMVPAGDEDLQTKAEKQPGDQNRKGARQKVHNQITDK